MRWGSLGMLLLLAGAACSEEEGEPSERREAPADPAFEGDDATLCSGRRLPIYVDQDGDGASVGSEVGGRCEEDGPGEGYTFNPPSFGTDCDDSDPERIRGHDLYTDADGDGFGVSPAAHRHSCEGVEIDGFASNARDCDDSDPGAHLERYVDEDGDGYGVSGASCVASDDPSYSNFEGDCDDSEASVSPEEEELALDGVDSNCDGHDFPLEAEGGGTCEPPPVVEGEVTPTPDCSGPDLFVVAFTACTDCDGERGWIQIGNAGTEASEIELVYSALPNQPEFEPVVETFGSLAPGAVSELFELAIGAPGVELRVRPSGAEEDCNPLNERFEALVWFVDCVQPGAQRRVR